MAWVGSPSLNSWEKKVLEENAQGSVGLKRTQSEISDELGESNNTQSEPAQVQYDSPILCKQK